MKKLLVFGAGKSSTSLLQFLSENALKFKWTVTVADYDELHLIAQTHRLPGIQTKVIDIQNNRQRRSAIKNSDLVISLLPPGLHYLPAKDCIQYKKHLIIPSNATDDLRELDAEAKAAEVMIMTELGLKQGLEHMIAGKIMNSIRRVAGDVLSYKVFSGGLIAEEYINPPWCHKIVGNPQHLVLAGRNGAQYIENNRKIIVPYKELFRKSGQVTINGLGNLGYYPNDDATEFKELYDIPEADTLSRNILRNQNFIKGWGSLIQLGLTTLNDKIDTTNLTVRDWIRRKLAFDGPDGELPLHIAKVLRVKIDSLVMRMLQTLGLWERKPLPQGIFSSAYILEQLVGEKLAMDPWEQDLYIMQQEIVYTGKEKLSQVTNTLLLRGENKDHSALAKSFSLPIGILAQLIMTDRIKPIPGIQVPTSPNIYRPVLRNLEKHGISFVEQIH